MKKTVHLAILISICTSLVLSCATSPTGRRQLLLMPESRLNELGATSFAQLKQSKTTDNSHKTVSYVTCITNKLLVAMNLNPQEWQISVFNDDSPNAFALPGNKMGVHSGMLQLVQNQDQLAAVIGHEIGHVLAQHGNERMSQGLVAQMGMQASSIALGQDSKSDGLILGALGLGLQFGVMLPFSRTHEREADRLGLKYMAKAGFDPRQASELWRLMSQGGSTSPEFLSTHPSPQSRIEDLTKRAGKYVDVYQSVQPKPQCI